MTEEDRRIAEALAASRAAAASRSGAAASGARATTPPAPADQDRRTAAELARAPSPAPAPASERETATSTRAGAGARTHRVERGDTWYGIAREYGVAPRVLADANPDIDPERIQIGQTLRIPSAGGEVTTRVHQVGRGDTLWGIARRYNVTPDEIRAFNRMEDERVQVGQVLRIPPP